MLNHIIVGSVFTVDVQIKDRLETKAKTKSHHTCTPKINPGKIIKSLVENAKNSTVFALFQYSFLCIVFSATTHCVLLNTIL